MEAKFWSLSVWACSHSFTKSLAALRNLEVSPNLVCLWPPVVLVRHMGSGFQSCSSMVRSGSLCHKKPPRWIWCRHLLDHLQNMGNDITAPYLLRVALCLSKRYVQILTPGVCECDLTRKQSHWRCNQFQTRSYWIRVGPNTMICVLIGRGEAA